MPSEWIKHNGRRVLFTNFIGCDNEEKMLANLGQAVEHYKSSSVKVLGLWDMTEAVVTDGYMAKAKIYAKEVLNIKREKSAVIGLSSMKTILLEAYNKEANHGLMPFQTKEEALDYLTN